MKQCKKCFESKPLNEFYKKIENKDGVQKVCKDCDNKRHRQWRKKHPYQVIIMSRLQRERHPEEMRAAVREYGRKHKKEMQLRTEQWAKKNPKKTSAHAKVYYAIKIGKLKKENCYCGKRAHAHHDDYNKPLDVLWLCPIHHKERHMCLNANFLE